MNWTSRVDYDDTHIIEEIERQEDRGAAVIAGAYLEEFVVDAIKTRLENDELSPQPVLFGHGSISHV